MEGDCRIPAARVRTVQRWERDLHLPVHRIGRGKRSPVYAKVAELKFWLATSDVRRQEYEATSLNHALVAAPGPMLLGERASAKSLKRARYLLSEAKHLAHQIAETSVRQRRQAEDLQARILQMRARVR